jgi:hypothetical protein
MEVSCGRYGLAAIAGTRKVVPSLRHQRFKFGNTAELEHYPSSLGNPALLKSSSLELEFASMALIPNGTTVDAKQEGAVANMAATITPSRARSPVI